MEIKGRTVNVYLIGQFFDSDLFQAFFLEKLCQTLAELGLCLSDPPVGFLCHISLLNY